MLRKKIALAVSLCLTASLVLAGAVVAGDGDRNDDRIPDRWEKRHNLSLKVKQHRRDQDGDGHHGDDDDKDHGDHDGDDDDKGGDARAAHGGKRHGDDDCGDDALVAGTTVLEAELKVRGGKAVWKELELLEP